MQSGKDFRQADWDPNISERGWMHVSSSTQGDILVYSDNLEPVTVDVVLLTDRYVIKPEPKRAEVTTQYLNELYNEWSLSDAMNRYTYKDFLIKRLGL